jgi:hypothetical protein
MRLRDYCFLRSRPMFPPGERSQAAADAATAGRIAAPCPRQASTGYAHTIDAAVNIHKAERSCSGADLRLPELFTRHRADFGSNLLSDARTVQVIAERVVDERLIVAAMGIANTK